MRRFFLTVFAVLALLLWVVGCGGAPETPAPSDDGGEEPATSQEQPTEAPAETETESEGPTEEPEQSESDEPITIVFSNIAETGTLDPALVASSDGLEFVRNVYEGLLAYEPASPELVPALAESWEVSDDGLEHTFTLREGVTFHDGTPLNAEAVKLSFERIQAINQYPATFLTDLESVEAVDESTVRITLSQPNVYFLGYLPELAIVSPTAIEENKTEDDPWAQDFFATNGAGTGPYMFESWTKGSQIVMTKNTDYWQEWQPSTADRVILRVDPEVSTALQLLAQGEIDMLGAVGPDDSIAAQNMDGVKLVTQPQFQVSVLTLTTHQGPLADPLVREAVKYAFDYQAFVDFFQGLGEVPSGPLPNNAPGFDESLPTQEQDLERARELLAEAGYPDGGFTLRYLGLRGLSYEEFAGTLLQDNLGELGIEVEQILVPWPQMPPMMADRENAPDISFLNMSMATSDPTSILRTSYHSSNTPDNGGYNWAYYESDEVDQWLDEVTTIQDDAERTEMLHQIQQHVVEDVPVLYLIQPTLAQPVRENIEGAVYETLDFNYVVRFFNVQKMPE